MTAEIAVLNREAVALAADSAATIHTSAGLKVFNSVSKIFGLSAAEPVGVMFYGGAAFLDVPWDTVVKAYRDERGDKSFAHLGSFGDDFIDYLEGANKLFPKSAQDAWARKTIRGFFGYIEQKILEEVRDHLDQHGQISGGQIRGLVTAVVQHHHSEWKVTSPTDGRLSGEESAVKKALTTIISKERREVFALAPVQPITARRLGELAVWLFTRTPPEGRQNPGASGIVITGFGRDDFFPRLVSYEVDGMILGRVKYSAGGPIDITRTNTAAVAPFAQRDTVRAFMEGSHPKFDLMIEEQFTSLLTDYPAEVVDQMPIPDDIKQTIRQAFESANMKRMVEMQEAWQEHRVVDHVAPVLDVVAVLPKDELAMMAESLVSLTSFRHRVSFGAETVGGPVDVAVISKGDGFIWISRKHYFRRELNPQFFANRFGGINGSS